MSHLLTTFPLARVARPVTTDAVYIQVGPLLQTERAGGDFEGGKAVRILQSQFVQVSRDRRGCRTAVVRHREREDSRHFFSARARGREYTFLHVRTKSIRRWAWLRSLQTRYTFYVSLKLK